MTLGGGETAAVGSGLALNKPLLECHPEFASGTMAKEGP